MSLPSNTCPDIDSIIKELEWEIEHNEVDESALKKCIGSLEELRGSNIILREYAEKGEKLESENEVLSNRILELEEDYVC